MGFFDGLTSAAGAIGGSAIDLLGKAGDQSKRLLYEANPFDDKRWGDVDREKAAEEEQRLVKLYDNSNQIYSSVLSPTTDADGNRILGMNSDFFDRASVKSVSANIALPDTIKLMDGGEIGTHDTELLNEQLKEYFDSQGKGALNASTNYLDRLRDLASQGGEGSYDAAMELFALEQSGLLDDLDWTEELNEFIRGTALGGTDLLDNLLQQDDFFSGIYGEAKLQGMRNPYSEAAMYGEMIAPLAFEIGVAKGGYAAGKALTGKAINSTLRATSGKSRMLSAINRTLSASKVQKGLTYTGAIAGEEAAGVASDFVQTGELQLQYPIIGVGSEIVGGTVRKISKALGKSDVSKLAKGTESLDIPHKDFLKSNVETLKAEGALDNVGATNIDKNIADMRTFLGERYLQGTGKHPDVYTSGITAGSLTADDFYGLKKQGDPDLSPDQLDKLMSLSAKHNFNLRGVKNLEKYFEGGNFRAIRDLAKRLDWASSIRYARDSELPTLVDNSLKANLKATANIQPIKDELVDIIRTSDVATGKWAESFFKDELRLQKEYQSSDGLTWSQVRNIENTTVGLGRATAAEGRSMAVQRLYKLQEANPDLNVQKVLKDSGRTALAKDYDQYYGGSLWADVNDKKQINKFGEKFVTGNDVIKSSMVEANITNQSGTKAVYSKQMSLDRVSQNLGDKTVPNTQKYFANRVEMDDGRIVTQAEKIAHEYNIDVGYLPLIIEHKRNVYRRIGQFPIDGLQGSKHSITANEIEIFDPEYAKLFEENKIDVSGGFDPEDGDYVIKELSVVNNPKNTFLFPPIKWHKAIHDTVDVSKYTTPEARLNANKSASKELMYPKYNKVGKDQFTEHITAKNDGLYNADGSDFKGDIDDSRGIMEGSTRLVDISKIKDVVDFYRPWINEDVKLRVSINKATNKAVLEQWIVGVKDTPTPRIQDSAEDLGSLSKQELDEFTEQGGLVMNGTFRDGSPDAVLKNRLEAFVNQGINEEVIITYGRGNDILFRGKLADAQGRLDAINSPVTPTPELSKQQKAEHSKNYQKTIESEIIPQTKRDVKATMDEAITPPTPPEKMVDGASDQGIKDNVRTKGEEASGVIAGEIQLDPKQVNMNLSKKGNLVYNALATVAEGVDSKHPLIKQAIKASRELSIEERLNILKQMMVWDGGKQTLDAITPWLSKGWEKSPKQVERNIYETYIKPAGKGTYPKTEFFFMLQKDLVDDISIIQRSEGKSKVLDGYYNEAQALGQLAANQPGRTLRYRGLFNSTADTKVSAKVKETVSDPSNFKDEKALNSAVQEIVRDNKLRLTKRMDDLAAYDAKHQGNRVKKYKEFYTKKGDNYVLNSLAEKDLNRYSKALMDTAKEYHQSTLKGGISRFVDDANSVAQVKANYKRALANYIRYTNSITPRNFEGRFKQRTEKALSLRLTNLLNDVDVGFKILLGNFTKLSLNAFDRMAGKLVMQPLAKLKGQDLHKGANAEMISLNPKSLLTNFGLALRRYVSKGFIERTKTRFTTADTGVAQKDDIGSGIVDRKHVPYAHRGKLAAAARAHTGTMGVFMGTLDEAPKTFSKLNYYERQIRALAKEFDLPKAEMKKQIENLRFLYSNNKDLNTTVKTGQELEDWFMTNFEKMGNAQDHMKAMHIRADDIVADVTMSSPDKLAGRAGKFSNLVKNKAWGVAQLPFPVATSPTNILDDMFNRTPVIGVIKRSAVDKKFTKSKWEEVYTSAKDGDQAAIRQVELAMKNQQVMRAGQQVSGVALVAAGMYLFANNYMSGAYPKNEADREQWRLLGKIPFGFNYGKMLDNLGITEGGDRWISLDSLSNTFGGLIPGISYAEYLDEHNIDKDLWGLFTSPIGNYVNAIAEHPFFTAINDVNQVITEEDKLGELSDIGTRYVKSFYRWGLIQTIARLQDKTKPQSTTLIEKFLMEDTPFLRDLIDDELEQGVPQYEPTTSVLTGSGVRKLQTDLNIDTGSQFHKWIRDNYDEHGDARRNYTEGKITIGDFNIKLSRDKSSEEEIEAIMVDIKDEIGDGELKDINNLFSVRMETEANRVMNEDYFKNATLLEQEQIIGRIRSTVMDATIREAMTLYTDKLPDPSRRVKDYMNPSPNITASYRLGEPTPQEELRSLQDELPTLEDWEQEAQKIKIARQEVLVKWHEEGKEDVIKAYDIGNHRDLGFYLQQVYNTEGSEAALATWFSLVEYSKDLLKADPTGRAKYAKYNEYGILEAKSPPDNIAELLGLPKGGSESIPRPPAVRRATLSGFSANVQPRRARRARTRRFFG